MWDNDAMVHGVMHDEGVSCWIFKARKDTPRVDATCHFGLSDDTLLLSAFAFHRPVAASSHCNTNTIAQTNLMK